MPEPLRPTAQLSLLLLACACFAEPVYSADIDVLVLDEDSVVVPDVAVYAEPLDETNRTPMAHADMKHPAVMDQIGTAFVPHILVVQTGTAVDFPNNDTVSHHVYSFSKAKTFALNLYRGDPHPPQVFDQAGLVVLGCNIHDSMLGFILVVDTPYFAKTDAHGAVNLHGLPEGDYRVKVWTPRTNERNQLPARTLTIGSSRQEALTFQFTSKLQRPHSIDPGSLEWKHY
jgi:plastocyanin